MNRSESQFRHDQCERLLRRAQDCDDKKLHAQLVKMAKEWRPLDEREKPADQQALR